MKLTKERYRQACEFVKKNARSLDQEMYRYHFENGSKEDVLVELAAYQNLDGGFGHGIEPDFRSKKSSPMATSVGLQYYIDADGSPESDMVRGAIEYLVSTYDKSDDYWPSTYASVNEEPHAPWWHVEKIEAPSDENWANPSAEIAGYLNKYSKYVPSDLLSQVNQRVRTIITSQEQITGLLYNVMCWNRVYDFFPEPLNSEIRKRIQTTFNEIASTLFEKLGEIQIVWLATNTDSLVLSHPEVVYRLLKLEIEKQADDGGWWPTWKWGQYEDFWPIAEKEWAGKMTYKTLKSLRNLNLNNSLIEPLE